MLPSGRDEQYIARLEGMPDIAVLEKAVTADDNVKFIACMRLLKVAPLRPVYFHRECAVAKEFCEGFTFVLFQGLECFPNGYFHGKRCF